MLKRRLRHFLFPRNPGRIRVIDADGDVGDHVVQLFAGLMMHDLGERNFKVERLKERPPAGRIPSIR